MHRVIPGSHELIMVDLPFVSFCLTSYNQRLYIGAAVEAALAQDYENMEIIISDDASSDGSVDLIKSIVRDCKRLPKGGVRILESECNLGIVGNYEKMFKVAKGELFVGADGDDISLPNRVSRIVEAWIADGRNATIIFNDGIKIDPQGNEVGIVANRTVSAPLGALMTYSRICVDRFPAVAESGAAQDHVFNRRCAMLGPSLHVAERLVLYRLGTGVSSIWQSRRRSESRMAEIRRCGYLQSLKDIESARPLIGESVCERLKAEYLQGIEREKAGLILRQSKSFLERWCAWRALYPRMSKGALLYIPYLLPVALGDFLFDTQTKVKYFLYKLRKGSCAEVGS